MFDTEKHVLCWEKIIIMWIMNLPTVITNNDKGMQSIYSKHFSTWRKLNYSDIFFVYWPLVQVLQNSAWQYQITHALLLLVKQKLNICYRGFYCSNYLCNKIIIWCNVNWNIILINSDWDHLAYGINNIYTLL